MQILMAFQAIQNNIVPPHEYLKVINEKEELFEFMIRGIESSMGLLGGREGLLTHLGYNIRQKEKGKTR